MKTLTSPRFLGFALVAGLVITAGVYFTSRPRPDSAPKGQTVAVKRLDLPLTVSANGVVQPERSVNISPKNPGKLKELKVREGDRVQAGQVVALMDDSNLKGQVLQAQGQLLQAQANLKKLQKGNRPEEIAQAQMRRQDVQFALQLAQSTSQQDEELFKRGAISQRALDTSRIALERAQAQASLAQSTLQLTQRGFRSEDILQAQAQVLTAQGVLQSIQTQVNDTVIRAPFAGVISRKYAEPGAFVAPTTAGSAVSSATSSSILSLASKNWVVANVAESNIAQLKLKQPVTLTADAYLGKTFRGEVVEIAPQSVVAQNVTSFEVKVALLGEEAKQLRSGMNVDVAFQVGRLNQALLVPTVAIVRQESQTGVYVQDEKKKPIFRAITTGPTVATQTQVLTGLESGEQVLISFPEGFRPETKIPGMR
jgi:HlyD family secretion protein